MKISFINRLHLGSILLILVGSLIGVLFFHTIQEQLEEAEWVRGRHQQIQLVLRLEKLLADAESTHRLFGVSHTKTLLTTYSNTLSEVGSVLGQLAVAVRDSPRHVQKIGQLTLAVQNLLQGWSFEDTHTELAVAGAGGQVTAIETEQLSTLRQQLAALTQDIEQQITAQETKTHDRTRTLTDAAAMATAILFTLAAVLTFFYAQEFKRHREVANQLNANILELERLNQDTHNRNWLLTGVSTLHDALQNLLDTGMVARQVVDVLGRYLQVPAIGFYGYQDDTQRFELTASVAFPELAQQTYAWGESLVGQAATSRDITVVSHIPGTYWSIQSGTGAAVPVQVVFVPMWYSNELKAVIEIACFQPLTSNELALLKETSREIAIVLSTVQARQRKRQLLEQVQLQKTELENQQEELRQTNEELTRQAEVLQASEEELRVQEEELRQTNAELEERNEAIEVARQTLIAKTRELEVASKYKSEFLANMSHELRTPLNSVLILANLLAENKQHNLSPKQIEYAQVIHKSGSDLLELINDILDLSKIEAGKIDIHLEPVPIRTIVDDLQQLFTVVADQKGISFEIQVAGSVPVTIKTDKQRLEQTIRNLLSNAFKFTASNGTITLAFQTEKPSPRLLNPALTQADQVLVISVTDTGIGIPPDRQQLIFEAFQQADGSTSRKYGGTGLGLSITRELIRRLNGEIQLQSEPGKGSTFTIVLPIMTGPELRPQLLSQPIHLVAGVKRPAAPSVEPQPDDRKLIQKDDPVMLIIEDDPVFAGIVRDFARSRQFKTLVATRGDEGLELARTFMPAAIILDIQLPVMNGWEVLNNLKSDPGLRHIPVHIVTGLDDFQITTDGSLPYVQKPVSQKDLDHIFTLIGNQLTGQQKKVLIQSGNYLKDDALRQFIEQRHFELDCDYVSTKEEVLERVTKVTYDCLIVDMGHDLKAGITELRQLRTRLAPHSMPVIIYIDEDLSPANELKLKRLSDVVIRESSESMDRLMDELELFLYKVQEDKKRFQPVPNLELSDKGLEGRKVLLVDDDMRNIFALSTLMEQHQMQVITADNGREALEVLQKNKDTDIVLMDIMMPEMDGYEATYRIRNELNMSELPIIALTAKAMPGDREKVIEAGASDYIAKPVDKSQLFSLMRVWLSR